MTDYPEPDEDDLLATDIDGSTVRRTRGASYTLVYEPDQDEAIALYDDESRPAKRMTADRLLTMLSVGEYYLPDGDTGLQNALRHLSDDK